MPLWNPTTWAPGTALTGALLNTFFDSIGTALTAIDMTMFAARARFPLGMFAQQHAYDVVGISGFDFDGNARANTLTRYAPSAGTLVALDGGVTVSVGGSAVIVGASIAEGDEIAISVASGGAGAAHFTWPLVL